MSASGRCQRKRVSPRWGDRCSLWHWSGVFQSLFMAQSARGGQRAGSVFSSRDPPSAEPLPRGAEGRRLIREGRSSSFDSSGWSITADSGREPRGPPSDTDSWWQAPMTSARGSSFSSVGRPGLARRSSCRPSGTWWGKRWGAALRRWSRLVRSRPTRCGPREARWRGR